MMTLKWQKENEQQNEKNERYWKSLQDNSVECEKQMQIQAKEVKKEEEKEEKEKKKENEKKQNKTSDQGLDGVYPWLQKLNETRTHFNILLSRVKGPWLSTLQNLESMLSKENIYSFAKTAFFY